MQQFLYPDRNQWSEIAARPVQSLAEIEVRVQPVMDRVKADGDSALKAFTLQFDGVELSQFTVQEQEFEEAAQLVSDDLKQAIQVAIDNITIFHQQQFQEEMPIETEPGVLCWRKWVGIEKVGLYIPGGTAPLFSTVLMLAIPAKLAGCKTVVLCSPPNKEGKIHPAILYAAQLCGVQQVFKVGGAQAIGAMTFGTETVPQVYKIFGPGNQYVTAAKQLAMKAGVAIDMPAGPSEVAVVADFTANPDFIAADLLSQAEHGADSQVVFVTTDEALLEKVKAAVEEQVSILPRMEFARKALDNSRMILLESLEEAMDFINEYAPEHLILQVAAPELLAPLVINAGSVFMGHFTPEAAGDYASGTNHTLPTNGYARAYSGVSLDSFVKKITFQSISEAGLKKLGPVIETMAAAESLQAHKNAVSIRLKALK
jgi:histidinol dehydrogenase